MADDPRIESMAAKWRALDPTETGRTVEQFIAELLPAADAVDPLRRLAALLVDEPRAVNLIAKTAWHADGLERGPWENQPSRIRESWLIEASAVLAALREVAGL